MLARGVWPHCGCDRCSHVVQRPCLHVACGRTVAAIAAPTSCRGPACTWRVAALWLRPLLPRRAEAMLARGVWPHCGCDRCSHVVQRPCLHVACGRTVAATAAPTSCRGHACTWRVAALWLRPLLPRRAEAMLA